MPLDQSLLLAADSYTHDKWIAIAGTTAIVIVAIAFTYAGGRPDKGRRRVLAVLMGKDGRLSTSKTVAAIWTVVVAYIFVALLINWPDDWSHALRNFAPPYLLLLGGPFAALVLAKAAVSSRVANGTLNKLERTDGPPRISDLVNDDKAQPDLFDMQYVTFNAIAVAYVLAAFSRATLDGFPAIPDAILLLTGGPAAVYLSNKFMATDAPVIFGVAPATVRVGETFTITGQNLATSGQVAAPTITVAAKEATGVSAWTPTSIQAIAPDIGADLGNQVGVGVKTPAGAQVYLEAALRVTGPIPQLYGVDRGLAQTGDTVGLRGDWGDLADRSIAVVLDGSVLGRLRSQGDGTVSFVVPPLADLTTPRHVPVKIKIANQDSNAITLEISQPVTPSAVGANGAASGERAVDSLGSPRLP